VLSDRAWAAAEANKATKVLPDLKKYKSITDGDTPLHAG
jgi:hypothetical protein